MSESAAAESAAVESAAAEPTAAESAAAEPTAAEVTGTGSTVSDSGAGESAAGAEASGPRRKKRSTGSQKPVAADDVVGPADPGTLPARLTGAGARSSRGRLSVRTMYILVGVLVLLAGVFGTGAWFASSKYSEASASTSNTALINVDRTQQVKKAMSKAAERLFSYDYRKIDKTKKAADELLANSEVKNKYDMLMQEVKRLAPKQKAVVSVNATESAVVSLRDDHAKVIVYVDQTSKRTKSKETAAGGAALWLTTERRDGEWKVVGMDTYSSDESGDSQQDKGDKKNQQSGGSDADRDGKSGNGADDSDGAGKDEQGNGSQNPSSDSSGN